MFYAIRFEWDWIGLITDLIFVGLPFGIITYLVIRSRYDKRINELEKRLEKLEQEKSK
ncbi:hypothetical protein [Brevibacillus sp. FIR094]|uniref:hypothetical protein n=1 Tax=Brevibacillus sp. FIR094 TaxID=3134809 RepID=UPI003D1F224F